MGTATTFILFVIQDDMGNQTSIISRRSFFKKEILPRIKQEKVPCSQQYTVVFDKQNSLPIYKVRCKNNELINELISLIIVRGCDLIPVRILTDRLYLEYYISKLPKALVQRLSKKGIIRAKTNNGSPVICAYVESN